MKLTTINLLRGGVFSLAVVAAFAFTTPVPNNLYGSDGTFWYDVTDLDEVDDYVCDPGSQTCLYDAPHGSGNPIGLSDKSFRLITPQPPVDM